MICFSNYKSFPEIVDLRLIYPSGAPHQVPPYHTPSYISQRFYANHPRSNGSTSSRQKVGAICPGMSKALDEKRDGGGETSDLI